MGDVQLPCRGFPGGIPIVDQVAGDEPHANTATWRVDLNKIGILEDEVDTVIYWYLM